MIDRDLAAALLAVDPDTEIPVIRGEVPPPLRHPLLRLPSFHQPGRAPETRSANDRGTFGPLSSSTFVARRAATVAAATAKNLALLILPLPRRGGAIVVVVVGTITHISPFPASERRRRPKLGAPGGVLRRVGADNKKRQDGLILSPPRRRQSQKRKAVSQK